jgi:hypothetical protein
MNPPLTGDLGARFLPGRSTCALCGREVSDDGAPVICELDAGVESAANGLHLLADVTPGERLVICRECDPA